MTVLFFKKWDVKFWELRNFVWELWNLVLECEVGTCFRFRNLVWELGNLLWELWNLGTWELSLVTPVAWDRIDCTFHFQQDVHVQGWKFPVLIPNFTLLTVGKSRVNMATFTPPPTHTHPCMYHEGDSEFPSQVLAEWGGGCRTSPQ